MVINVALSCSLEFYYLSSCYKRCRLCFILVFLSCCYFALDSVNECDKFDFSLHFFNKLQNSFWIEYHKVKLQLAL